MYFYVICNMPYVNFLILFLLGYISFVVESAYLTVFVRLPLLLPQTSHF